MWYRVLDTGVVQWSKSELPEYIKAIDIGRMYFRTKECHVMLTSSPNMGAYEFSQRIKEIEDAVVPEGI